MYDVSADVQHTSDSLLGQELIVGDVTDPAHSYLRSSTPATTSTHTVARIGETDCRLHPPQLVPAQRLGVPP